MSDDTNGWEEYRALVLHEIERLDNRMSEVHEDVRALRAEQAATREDVAGLKVQAGVTGGIAGLVSSFIGYFIPKP